METDARGQLGGLDTTEAVRRSLARDSAYFRCPTCARSNTDIMAESEKRAQDLSSPQEAVQVPQELRIGWRDEMGTMKPLSDTPPDECDSDSADLAEGFVETAPSVSESRPMQPCSLASSHSVRQPNPDVAGAAMTVNIRNSGLLWWIDRAIVALVIVLIALLIKVLFGS